MYQQANYLNNWDAGGQADGQHYKSWLEILCYRASLDLCDFFSTTTGPLAYATSSPPPHGRVPTMGSVLANERRRLVRGAGLRHCGESHH